GGRLPTVPLPPVPGRVWIAWFTVMVWPVMIALPPAVVMAGSEVAPPTVTAPVPVAVTWKSPLVAADGMDRAPPAVTVVGLLRLTPSGLLGLPRRAGVGSEPRSAGK